MSEINFEQLQTLNGAYILEEIKKGFDVFELGSTGIEITMRPRVGNAEFVNFSKHCRVVCAPTDGKYRQGDAVWVSHLVAKNKHPMTSGTKLFYCGEHNILFSGENIAQMESDEWIVFQIKKNTEVNVNGIIVMEQENDELGIVVCGALPSGSKITWVTSRRHEFFQKEVQYWVAHIDDITSVNGTTHGDYYAIDLYMGYERVFNGVVLRGQSAIAKELGVSEIPPKHYIVALSNPLLPLHGKVGLIRPIKKMPFIGKDDVVCDVEELILEVRTHAQLL